MPQPTLYTVKGSFSYFKLNRSRRWGKVGSNYTYTIFAYLLIGYLSGTDLINSCHRYLLLDSVSISSVVFPIIILTLILSFCWFFRNSSLISISSPKDAFKYCHNSPWALMSYCTKVVRHRGHRKSLLRVMISSRQLSQKRCWHVFSLTGLIKIYRHIGHWYSSDDCY